MMSERSRIDTKQARLLRFVQIQATRVIPCAHAERNKMQIRDRFGIQIVKLAPRRRVEILDDRQRSFANERKTASSRIRLVGICGRVETKDADGGYDESAAAKENQHSAAAFAAAGNVSRPKRSQRWKCFIGDFGLAPHPKRRGRDSADQQE